MGYTDKQFIEKIKPCAMEDMRKNNILASLTIAQAFLESNKGNSGLTQNANNLFGIKGKYNGNSVKMKTKEYVNGQYITVYADFRAYPSWLESIYDHSAFLKKYKRYASIIGETDYRQACKKMGASGYATAPDYEQKLLNIVLKYELYKIDDVVTGGNTEAPTSQEAKLTLTVGQTYTTTANLFIRTEPSGDKKLLSQITKNAKLHSYDDGTGHAILRKGTQVTCQGIVIKSNQTWIKIPSGYICAINNNGNIYLK